MATLSLSYPCCSNRSRRRTPHRCQIPYPFRHQSPSWAKYDWDLENGFGMFDWKLEILARTLGLPECVCVCVRGVSLTLL